MGYKERREAAGEYAAEHASEMLRDGSFDDEICQLIAEGKFDAQVKSRFFEILRKEVINPKDLDHYEYKHRG